MSQYMLLHMDEQTRINLMKQVLQFCYKLEHRGADRDSQVKPHVLQCVQVCQGLGISLDSLGLYDGIMQWVTGFFEEQEYVEEVDENPFADPIEFSSAVVDEFVMTCMQTKESLQRDVNPMHNETTTYMMLTGCKRAYRELRRSLEEYEGIPDSVKPALGDAITVLQDMVRLRSVYPEFISELEDFRESLND